MTDIELIVFKVESEVFAPAGTLLVRFVYGITGLFLNNFPSLKLVR
jgi:hypothetical protein